MATRFDYAAALPERQQRERRGTGPVSARTERRDRQRLQSLALHPGLQPVEDAEFFDPAGIQGPTPIQLPGDQWTQWEVTPSYGGRSGRRMSDAARYNAEAEIMQVRFARGGRGTPNVYQYTAIDPETWDNFMAGR
jgi:KTSC domain